MKKILFQVIFVFCFSCLVPSAYAQQKKAVNPDNAKDVAESKTHAEESQEHEAIRSRAETAAKELQVKQKAERQAALEIQRKQTEKEGLALQRIDIDAKKAE